MYLTSCFNSSTSIPENFDRRCIARVLVAESGKLAIINIGDTRPIAFSPCLGEIAVIVKECNA